MGIQFINTLLGGKPVANASDSLLSETSQVEAFIYNHPDVSDCRLIIVDTPGFDDTYVSEPEILRRIAVWLAWW